jgi:transcriptional regulator with XRE-family HTH domain
MKKGMSQKVLADQLHVERSTVAGWETKDRVPDAEILIRLAAVLGTTVDNLLKK